MPTFGTNLPPHRTTGPLDKYRTHKYTEAYGHTASRSCSAIVNEPSARARVAMSPPAETSAIFSRSAR